MTKQKQKTTTDILNEQEEKKISTKNAVLNALLEDDDEYDARIKELRSQDVIMTTKARLVVPAAIKAKYKGFKLHWASNDPKASPSVEELKSRGYRVIPNAPVIETGHHSTSGAGFHVLMACPEDLANQRGDALAKKARDDYERVFKKQEVREQGNDSKTFQYQENKIEGTTVKPYKPE